MEVRLLIQTTSNNAQHQLDRLQRAAGNNDLQNLIETQGAFSHHPCSSAAFLMLMHAVLDSLLIRHHRVKMSLAV